MPDWDDFRRRGNRAQVDFSPPAKMDPPTVYPPEFPETAPSTLICAHAAAPVSPRRIKRYDLRWSTDEVNWTLVRDITPVQPVTKLPQNTTLYFQTRAANSAGDGEWSDSTPAAFGVPPLLETGASYSGTLVTVGVTAFNVQDYTFAMSVNGTPVAPDRVAPARWTYEIEPSLTDTTVTWLASATNSVGTSTSSGEIVVPPTLVVPVITVETAVVDGAVLTVTVEATGTPLPQLTVAFEVDGTPVDMTPDPANTTGSATWTYEFADAGVAQDYDGTVTAENGSGTADTFVFSGTYGATIAVPGTLGSDDWSLTDGLVATAPGTLTDGEWETSFSPPVATAPAVLTTDDWSLTFEDAPAEAPGTLTDEQWSTTFESAEPPPPPQPPPPPSGEVGAPTNFNTTTVNDRAVTLQWGVPTTGVAQRYDAEYSETGSVWVPITGVTSPYTVNNLPLGGWLYRFRVAAVNGSNKVYTDVRTARTHERAYGLAAEWNLPISQAVGRGTHPNERYFRSVLYDAARGVRANGDNVFQLFNRDYTYPVYKSSDANGQTATVSVSAGNWRNGVIPWRPQWVIPDGTDAQIIILDEDTGVEFNGWNLRYDAGTNRIVSRNGGTARMNRITANPDGSGGVGNFRTKANGFRESRGCGIQYLAMLIRPEEIAQGRIYHALSVVMGRSGYRYFCNPATKGERFDNGQNIADQGVPQGTRFYFDFTEAEQNAYINSLPSGVPQSTRNSLRVVLRAMCEYGMIASDQGGANHIQFQHDASTDWRPFGLTPEVSAGGKSWPRDFLDGLMANNKSRIRFVLPPDGELFKYERASDNPPRGPVACRGDFPGEGTLTTDGYPVITRSGNTLTLTTRGQFVGLHPLTLGTPQWFRNGSLVGSGTSYNTGGTAGSYYCEDRVSNPNGSATSRSNTITI